MAKEGRELGLILEKLWLAGRSNLPTIAESFAQANNVLAGGADGAAAFAREGTIPGSPGITGTVYGIYPVWNQLRAELQTIMGQSATNVREAGEALVTIANMYAAEDDLAAQKLAEAADDDFENADPAEYTTPIMPE